LGILLGQHATKANQYTVNVANSFAGKILWLYFQFYFYRTLKSCWAHFLVPFDEDEKDPSIWFLDHNYLESMFEMFKSINGNTKLAYTLYDNSIWKGCWVVPLGSKIAFFRFGNQWIDQALHSKSCLGNLKTSSFQLLTF
jgi:hypothetical protein